MSRQRVTSIVKQNLDLWLNDLLLRDGFFTTISVGETDVYNRDMSRLFYVEDESFQTGSVWQSYFKNWVHESGIVPTDSGIAPPILPSGIVLNGTFFPQSSGSPGYSGVYAHNFDFPNGRVLFSSPIPTGSTVSVAFSHKHVSVEFADTQEAESRDLIVETAFKDNPSQTGVIVLPPKNSVILPAIFISMTSRTNNAYELGSASNVAELRGAFSIWSRDSYTKDGVEDLIEQQEHTVLLGIDFNTAPQPLTYLGDKNGSFTSYDVLTDEWGEHFYKRIYIDELNQVTVTPYMNIERGRINFVIRVFPNF